MRPRLFPLLFPKDSESLKNLDIQLWEVGSKRRLNGTTKVNRQTDKQINRQTDTRTDISTYRKHRPRGPMLWKLETTKCLRFRFFVAMSSVEVEPDLQLCRPGSQDHPSPALSYTVQWGRLVTRKCKLYNNV